MGNSIKRFLSLALALMMVISMVPTTVFATEAEATECAHVYENGICTLCEAAEVPEEEPAEEPSVEPSEEPSEEEETEEGDEPVAQADEELITGTITENMTWNDGDVVENVTISGNVTITVKGTVTVTGTIRLSPDSISNVTFNGENNAKLIRGGEFTGQMFYCQAVSGNFHNMTFNNITLDGGAVWTGDVDKTLKRGKTNSGVKATGSVLYLQYTNAVLNKSTLQNHDDSTGEKANAVFLRYYSTITFNNSVVCNNNSPSGYYSGGVITVRQGGTAKTYNSEVYGNSGVQGGFFGVSSTGSFGGVCEVYNSKFHNNFADAGALFDMQCNSNRGYLLIDGCEFYQNASNRGLIYEHAYSRPVTINESYFHDNECAVWDCQTDPILNLSGKIVIEADPDYSGYLYETPIVLGGPLAEGSYIALNEASVAKLMASGYVVTGNADYAVTADDVAKLSLPEDYEIAVVDVNGDGMGDVVSVKSGDPGIGDIVVLYLKDSADAEASATATVYSNISCLPVNPFAHEGLTFAGWIDAEGNAVAKQKFAESVNLTVTWKIETPVVKLSREDAALKATVTNKYDNLTYTYQWYMDDAAIEGATSETYTMTDINSHSYKCEVTAACEGMASVTASASSTSSAPAAVQIGDAKYATLAAAIEAANAGDTITFLADITEDVTVNKAVTIDGQGFTLGGTVNLAVPYSDKTMKFVNVEFKTANTNSIYVNETSYNVTFDACTFKGAASYAFEIPARTSANNFQFINQCEVNMTSDFMQISGTASDMLVDGMHFVSCGNCFKVNKNHNAITFKGVTVDDAYIFIYGMGYNNMAFAIDGCTIKAAFPFVRQDKAVMTYTYTFTGENEIVANPDPTAPVSATEYDGLYIVNGSDKGATVVWNGLESAYVAQIGETKYKTVEEAFAAATNGETVELIADTYEDIVIPAEFTGTLAIGTCELTSITNNSATAKIVINGEVEVNNPNGSAITGEVINISGDGKLTAIAGDVNGAFGIGGMETEEINISGITIVKVQGGHYGKIGTDTKYYKDAPEGGAAIGSGSNGAVINLTNVKIEEALGGSKAAGIGAEYHTGVTINITGCKINYVEGGATAAGIGGSRVSEGATDAENVTINIQNSTITAVGGVFAAGIGSGYDTHCQANQPICTINIDGSTINATGGKYAAGVGTGYHNAGLAGEIKNSTVTAASGDKVYKDTYTSAQDIGFGVADLAREGNNNDSYIVYNGTKITLPGNVAQIGETKYKTLADAIAAANTGDTITFLADITEDVTVNKAVTIDGDAKQYTGTITISGDCDVTVQNLNCVKGYIKQIGSDNAGKTLKVLNCTFTNGGYAVETAGLRNLVIENCTVTGQSLLYARLTTSNITVKNVTVAKGNYVAHLVYGNNAYFENVTATEMTGYGICTQNYGAKTITLKNCSFDAPTYYALAVRDDRTTAADTFIFEGANSMSSLYNSQYAKYELKEGATLAAPEGANVTTNVPDYIVNYAEGKYTLVNAVKVTITVNDATMVEGNDYPEFSYTTDVECPALTITYTVDENNKINATVAEMDGYEFTVVPGTLTTQKALVRVFAKNNANVKYFANFKEAMEYAASTKVNTPVYLLSNITVDETIVINDTNAGLVELQGDQTGARTYTLTSTHDGELFKVEKGTLAVKNLKINTQGDSFYVTGGTLNLNYHSVGKQFLEITSQTGNCIYTRGGDVNVNGAKLTALGAYPAIQGNGNYAGNVTLNKWNIGDGIYPEISAPNSGIAIYWPQNGTLTVEGGKITGNTALYAKSGTIVINGGEFIGNGDKVDFKHYSNGAYATGDAVVIEACSDTAYETPTVTITGGTFTSANAEAVMFYNCSNNADAAAIIEISGGTYTTRPSSTWCAEGYLPVFADAKSKTTWSVQEATAVAAIGDEMYAKVQHATNDAVAGDEIDLIADVENQPIYVDVAITLDLNGHTYKQTQNKQAIIYTKNGSQKYLDVNNYKGDNKGMINVMGGSLTVKDSVGTGMIESTVGNIFAIAKPLTIESGIFKVGTVAKDTTRSAYVIATKNTYTYGTELNINGGEFYTADGGVPFYLGFVAKDKTDKISIEKAWFSESIQASWIDAKNAKGFTYCQSEAKSSIDVDGYLVTKGAITVDNVWFGSWDEAESSIKKNSTIVLYADVFNYYGGTVARDFKFPTNGGNITLNLNGHIFTSAKSDKSAVTSVTVQYGTTLNIIGGGKIVIENNSYPFVINPNSTVNIDENVTFSGAMQWNVNAGNSGNLYVGDTALVGVNGVFKPMVPARIIVSESGDWTLALGSLSMQRDDATLADKTLTINKGYTIDLNGNDLTAKNIAVYGNLIDSADGVGTVATSGKYYYTNHNNSGYMPLYDDEVEAYRLFLMTIQNRGAKKVNDDKIKYGFTVRFSNVDAYLLLIESVQDINLAGIAAWSVDGEDNVLVYNFEADVIASHAQKVYDQIIADKNVTNAFTLNASGLSKLPSGTEITGHSSLTSVNDVVIESESTVYTKP